MNTTILILTGAGLICLACLTSIVLVNRTSTKWINSLNRGDAVKVCIDGENLSAVYLFRVSATHHKVRLDDGTLHDVAGWELRKY